MNRAILSVLSAAAAIPLLAVAAPNAGASPAPSPKTSRVAPAALSNYQQRVTRLVADPAHTATRATITCPVHTRAIGGGAVISSSSLDENLHASYPNFIERTWVVNVNNDGDTDGTFQVWAECVHGIANYQNIEGIGVDNPAGTQVTATANCPSGTVPVAGGGNSIEPDTTDALSSSTPIEGGWQVKVNNYGTNDNFVQAFVVCSNRSPGYAVVNGTPTILKAFSQGSASVTCPVNTVVFSGGGQSNSGVPTVVTNSNAPSGNSSWQVFQNNDQRGPSTVAAWAVCGAVT